MTREEYILIGHVGILEEEGQCHVVEFRPRYLIRRVIKESLSWFLSTNICYLFIRFPDFIDSLLEELIQLIFLHFHHLNAQLFDVILLLVIPQTIICLYRFKWNTVSNDFLNFGGTNNSNVCNSPS